MSTYQDRELTGLTVGPAQRETPERTQFADVLSVVAHDLREPLAVIGMCARAVEGLTDGRAHVDAAKVREAMTTIRETAGWMERLIQDLLDIATIEAGHLPLELRRADVVVTLMRAVELFDGLAAERSIRLATDVPDHLPLIPADPARVLQVLANLLGNAIKFTEPGGRVTVRARATPTDVVVSVLDTGAGVPPEHASHIFDRFWCAHHASESTPGGSRARGVGLGLAIAKGIVEGHGGKIWVESDGPGKGSAFYFTLPIYGGRGISGDACPSAALFTSCRPS